MEYPLLDRSKCKPFKCLECTDKSKCDHGFKTYRIPTVDEFYGYGIHRDLNSGPIPYRMNRREERRPLDPVFMRHQPNYGPGTSNYEYVRPISANGTTYYEYISYPGISSSQSMRNPQNWGRLHGPRPESSRPQSWSNQQRSMPGTSSSQNWRSRHSSVFGTSSSQNSEYQQNYDPQASNSQNLRLQTSSEVETLDMRGIVYTPNQRSIPRRYFPYDYYLSRDMILKRIRNRNLN